jgi:hypothetical protein
MSIVLFSTTITFRKVDICSSSCGKGEKESNLTGVCERCFLCLNTDRDSILEKVLTHWDNSPSHLPTIRRKKPSFRNEKHKIGIYEQISTLMWCDFFQSSFNKNDVNSGFSAYIGRAEGVQENSTFSN